MGLTTNFKPHLIGYPPSHREPDYTTLDSLREPWHSPLYFDMKLLVENNLILLELSRRLPENTILTGSTVAEAYFSDFQRPAGQRAGHGLQTWLGLNIPVIEGEEPATINLTGRSRWHETCLDAVIHTQWTATFYAWRSVTAGQGQQERAREALQPVADILCAAGFPADLKLRCAIDRTYPRTTALELRQFATIPNPIQGVYAA